MRECVTKYVEFFAPELGLSILEAVRLRDRIVRRRSTTQESQIMHHSPPLPFSLLRVVTNAVALILKTKRQTSYWTFVQCLNSAETVWESSPFQNMRARATEEDA